MSVKALREMSAERQYLPSFSEYSFTESECRVSFYWDIVTLAEILNFCFPGSVPCWCTLSDAVQQVETWSSTCWTHDKGLALSFLLPSASHPPCLPLLGPFREPLGLRHLLRSGLKVCNTARQVYLILQGFSPTGSAGGTAYQLPHFTKHCAGGSLKGSCTRGGWGGWVGNLFHTEGQKRR